nr:hypothetical protein [Tanacetum cinerariifolium]
KQMVALVVDMKEDLAMLFGDDDFSDDDFEGFVDDEEVGGPSTVAVEGHSFTLPTLGFPVPPSVIKDLCTRIERHANSTTSDYGYRDA